MSIHRSTWREGGREGVQREKERKKCPGKNVNKKTVLWSNNTIDYKFLPLFLSILLQQ